jgi:hypothetical protein
MIKLLWITLTISQKKQKTADFPFGELPLCATLDNIFFPVMQKQEILFHQKTKY